MTIYRMAKGWRIVIYVISPPMIALFVFMLTLPWKTNSVLLYALLIPVSVAMILLFLYGLADTYIGRFVVAHDRIILRSPFGIRMLMLEEIRGFKVDENYIRIMPLDEKKKSMKITTYIERTNEIILWLSTNYPDLTTTAGDEEQQILQEVEFGMTEESRALRLKEARKAARWVNITSFGFLAWVMLCPEPYYGHAMAIAAFFPMMVMAVPYVYRGLMKGDEQKNSPYPSTALGFMVSVSALAFRAIVDFHILDHRFIWGIIAFMAIVLTGLYLLPGNEWKVRSIQNYSMIAVILFFMTAYSYGICIATNCLLDHSRAQYHRTTIVEKRTSTGDNTSYYLTLHPWASVDKPEEVKVRLREYESTNVGDTLTVIQKKGYLDMPWIVIAFD